MGIPYLETYLEEDLPSECCYRVQIKKLVEDFRRENGKQQKPIILFHFSTAGLYFFKGIDWVYGGQCKQELDKIGAVVTAFQKLGIQPVFFIRGFSDQKNDAHYSKKFKKGLAKIRKGNKFFDCFEKGDRGPYCNPRLDDFSFEDLSYYLSAMHGCEVHKSTTNCNKEIVLYVRENPNCIATFAQDTNFIIHDTGKYYLSAKHFNIQTMTTCIYSREGLANKLGLDQRQLPLLGALSKPKKLLQPFMGTLIKGSNINAKKERFSNIAEYIKALPYNKDVPFEEANLEILPHIAKEIFKEEKAEGQEFLAVQSLAAKVPKYQCSEGPVDLKSEDPKWQDILQRAEELHRSNKNPTIIRRILNNQPFQSYLNLEDRRNDDAPSSLRITRPLRQVLYGILLKEKPPNHTPNSVIERCVEGLNPTECISVEPLPPTDHPGSDLLALWSDDRSRGIQEIRWQLFAHSVSPHLDHHKLKNLPANLILPTAALYYLWEYEIQSGNSGEKLLLKPEIKALIATTVLLAKTSNQMTGPPSRNTDPRSVTIASIFNRTLTSITDILAICGYPLSFERTFAYPYFNGRLFQKKYQEAVGKLSTAHLCENNETYLAQFYRISSIVFKPKV